MLVDLLSNHKLRRWIRTCYRLYKVKMTASEVLGLLRRFLRHEGVKRWSLDTLEEGGKESSAEVCKLGCAGWAALRVGRFKYDIVPCVKIRE